MSIRHLRIFIQVYRDRNMTAAARQLYMSQPSVSQAIKELEDYYGVTLFDRLSQRLFVTSAGEKLFQYATNILLQFDELEDSLHENTSHTPIRVGTNYTVGIAMIHSYIQDFHKEYSCTPVQVFINKASVLKDMLRTNKIDFALFEKSNNEPDFTCEFLCKDRIAAVCHPDYPLPSKELTLPEFASLPFLLRESGAGARDMFDHIMKQQGYPIIPCWESISATALIQAAKEKAGIAILPFESVRSDLQNHLLIEIQTQFMNLDRDLLVVYHKNKHLTSTMKSFISVCKEIGNPNQSL